MHPTQSEGLLWGRGAEAAGRAPFSKVGSDGEPWTGRHRKRDSEGPGRWLGGTPGDSDREERGGKEKGRVKVAPTPQILNWWRLVGQVGRPIRTGGHHVPSEKARST